jgi:hypothetical protein
MTAPSSVMLIPPVSIGSLPGGRVQVHKRRRPKRRRQKNAAQNLARNAKHVRPHTRYLTPIAPSLPARPPHSLTNPLARPARQPSVSFFIFNFVAAWSKVVIMRGEKMRELVRYSEAHIGLLGEVGPFTRFF